MGDLHVLTRPAYWFSRETAEPIRKRGEYIGNSPRHAALLLLLDPLTLVRLDPLTLVRLDPLTLVRLDPLTLSLDPLTVLPATIL